MSEYCHKCGEKISEDDSRLCANCETQSSFAPLTGSASQEAPTDQYPKCRHCGSDKGYWFSRTLPMGNFCENCGGPWTETDGVELDGPNNKITEPVIQTIPVFDDMIRLVFNAGGGRLFYSRAFSVDSFSPGFVRLFAEEAVRALWPATNPAKP